MAARNSTTRHSQLAVVLVIFAVCFSPAQLQACGPYFPNRLLSGNDNALLVAPEARFHKEIERMQLVSKPAQQVRINTNDFSERTVDAELEDLKAALARSGIAFERCQTILSRHQQERGEIAPYPALLRTNPSEKTRIPGAWPEITPGLPVEFADYFRGAIAWHAGVIDDARASWKTLLARPVAQRRFKSTWAAFMLGKSWEEEEHDKAIPFFQEVRRLAKEGFADSLNLARASLGWEARTQLREKRYVEAIELYLAQAAAGDETAFLSLRVAAAFALRDPNAPLRSIAAHNQAQRVVTAYIISGGYQQIPIDVDGAVGDAILNLLAKAPYFSSRAPGWHRRKAPVLLWLDAVESAKVKDVASAEELAVAAYQAGQMEVAQRWINRAKQSPVAQWLQAKLLLRDGKLDEAGALLAKVSRTFALNPAPTNSPPRYLHNTLLTPEYGEPGGTWNYFPALGVSPQDQTLGELGVLRLVRRQYVEALDALLRSGFWADAAFVAERVLTTDELKSYVDRYWPATLAAGSGNSDAQLFNSKNWPWDPGLRPSDRHSVAAKCANIRYLLARRLARENRRQEAAPYYPRSLKARFDAFAKALDTASNLNLSNQKRGAALFQAARIARYEGLELLGTTEAPDGGLTAGNFMPNDPSEIRGPSTNLVTLAATPDESQRTARHHPEPDIRWHYRTTAAALAWEAAKLMPDNSEETARALCLAGKWIQGNSEANLFYKTLVRRCRKTAIGAAAVRQGWFPALDASGNLAPTKKTPPAGEEVKQ